MLKLILRFKKIYLKKNIHLYSFSNNTKKLNKITRVRKNKAIITVTN